jgi:hypothetical protein
MGAFVRLGNLCSRQVPDSGSRANGFLLGDIAAAPRRIRDNSAKSFGVVPGQTDFSPYCGPFSFRRRIPAGRLGGTSQDRRTLCPPVRELQDAGRAARVLP